MELYESDKKMIELVEILKGNGMIRYRQAFTDAIGLPKTHWREMVNGIRHFSPDHIAKACREYGVNANWIMGLEDKVFRLKAARGKEIGV